MQKILIALLFSLFTINCFAQSDAENYNKGVGKYKDGDYKGATDYLMANGMIRETLQADLQRLKTANIPVDIVYEQGLSALGF